MAAERKFKPNPGYCPRSAKGKRVIVQLNNGTICGEEPVTTVSPPGWAADGKQGCDWTIDRQYSFAIAGFYVIGGP